MPLRDIFDPLLTILTFGAYSANPSNYQRVIDRKVQQMIAKGMTTDPYFSTNWKRFYDALHLEPDDSVRLERHTVLYNRYMDILDQWISSKPNARLGEFQQALRDEGFVKVADIIMQSQIPETESRTSRHGLCNISNTFIGRDKDLARLASFYEKRKALTVVIVYGLGGVGKTELVTAFAWRIVKENNVNVVWLNGDSIDTLKGCINAFVSETTGKQKSSGTNSSKEVADSFLACLGEYLGRWLIIFDNVDNVNSLVDRILTKLEKDAKVNCMVLVTSRNVTCIDFDSQSLSLDKFCRDDSIKLVTDKLSEIDTDELQFESDKIDELCYTLEDFPLALQQGVAYIKMQKRTSLEGNSYNISMYLGEFLNQPDKMLDHKIPIYGRTTLNTVNVTIAKLKDECDVGLLGIEILKLLAFVNPDGLRLKFLKILYKLYSGSDADIENAVRRIKVYSLIKSEEKVISIHRLVQTVIRLKMHEEIENAYDKLINILSKISCNQVQNVDVEHIKSIWKHLLGSNVSKDKLSLIPQKISDTYLQHSYFDAALKVCKDSLDFFSKEFEQNLAQKLNVKFNSARCYNYKEDYKSANSILEEVYSLVKEKFSDDDDFVLRLELETASVQRGLRKLEKSEELYSNALTLAKERFGDTHEKTMASRHGLGIVLLERKKFSESCAYLRQVYDWRIENLGPNDPSTYRTQYYLGKCLFMNDQILESKEILEKALTNENHYHDGHTFTMLILETIIDVYLAIHDHQNAENALRKICDVREKTLGRNHVRTVAALEQLGNLSTHH